MTAAIVLCAGLGTRLGPLTRELAKPLMPVGDRPVLAHIARQLEQGGVERIVANTHHRASDFPREIRRFEGAIHLVHESKILGTAGGVHHAANALGDGAIIVWNGDILPPELDVRALLAGHAASSVGLLWVVEPRVPGAGTVGLDREGCVVRLRDERFGEETSGGDFLGIQVMSPALRQVLPVEGCLVGDVALPHLRGGRRIATFLYRGAWDDIGQPGWLLRANLRWLERQARSAWSAADARVATAATLERSIVGAGGAVEGVGLVRECVVFPGARLTAPASRRLVAPNVSLAVTECA